VFFSGSGIRLATRRIPDFLADFQLFAVVVFGDLAPVLGEWTASRSQPDALSLAEYTSPLSNEHNSWALVAGAVVT